MCNAFCTCYIVYMVDILCTLLYASSVISDWNCLSAAHAYISTGCWVFLGNIHAYFGVC